MLCYALQISVVSTGSAKLPAYEMLPSDVSWQVKRTRTYDIHTPIYIPLVAYRLF